jgi:hypothetical protein
VGTLGAGALKEMFGGDTNIVFALSGFMFLAGFVISLRMKAGEPVPPAAEGMAKVTNLRTTMELFRHNKTVYTSFFMRQLGASAVWSIFPIFLASELGAGDFGIGAIYSTNAITQFVFMNRFGHFIQSNYYRSLQLGAMLSAVVFGLYFISQTYLHAFPIQVVLGVSWSTLYIGSLLF